MMTREEIQPFLREYCNNNSIDYVIASNQIRLSTLNYVGLFASDLTKPKTKIDGLANDRDMMMLPTLYIRKDEDGFQAEETPYTDRYLRLVFD